MTERPQPSPEHADAPHRFVETTTHGDLPDQRRTCVVCGAETVGRLSDLLCPGTPATRPEDRP